MSKVEFYNNQTTDEFIDAMLLNVPACQKMLKEVMDKNYQNGIDNIDEAFANLRLEVMKDVLVFIKNHKTMTETDMGNFISDKILKFGE